MFTAKIDSRGTKVIHFFHKMRGGKLFLVKLAFSPFCPLDRSNPSKRQSSLSLRFADAISHFLRTLCPTLGKG